MGQYDILEVLKENKNLLFNVKEINDLIIKKFGYRQTHITDRVKQLKKFYNIYEITLTRVIDRKRIVYYCLVE